MTYAEQLKNDVCEFISDEGYNITAMGFDAAYEALYDDLWVEDSVTGNGSGSYFCNRYLAKEKVLEDGFEYVGGMIREGLCGADSFVKYLADEDWESIDVMIRCYLLGSVLTEVLEEKLGEG